MNVHWYCYRFDHDFFLRLRPPLRAATTPAALIALAEGPEVTAIADALEDGETTLTQARTALIQATCCLGEPLPFDRGLPRTLARLARTEGMEDAALLLTEMLSAGRNMEPWLQPSSGIVGFLTPQESSAVYVSFIAWCSRRSGARRTNSQTRKGGLLPGCAGLIRQLLNGGPDPEDTLRLLGQLLDDAAHHRAGIAAVAIQ
jgi:hypothetical protein